MVIQDRQGIAIVAVCHPKLAFEIRLPHDIATVFFEPCVWLPFLRFLRADAAITVQDVIDCFYTRKVFMTFSGQYCVDRFGSPSRIVRTDRQDQLLDLFRCPGGRCMRSSAAVCERLAGGVPFFPFVAGMPVYPEFTA